MAKFIIDFIADRLQNDPDLLDYVIECIDRYELEYLTKKDIERLCNGNNEMIDFILKKVDEFKQYREIVENTEFPIEENEE